MIILNIETSTDACSAALTEGGKVVRIGDEACCRLEAEKSEHARRLALFIDELLTLLKQDGRKLDAVAVSAGPGSYTGLRIGASTAKDLAYGLNVPLVALPTLEVIAAAEPDGVIAAQIDARHGQAYSALYSKEGETLVQLEETALRNYDEAAFADRATVVSTRKPDAANMGALAEQRLQAGLHEDVAYWTPFYLQEYKAVKSAVKGLK